MIKPYIIDFSNLGTADIGYISALEIPEAVPFGVKRIFWTYHTPEMTVRGHHAHYATEQLLIAMAGQISVTMEMPNSEVFVFVLNSPHKGLYIPPYAWHTIRYSHSAVQLVLASTKYSEQDYIREYAEFKRVWNEVDSN